MCQLSSHMRYRTRVVISYQLHRDRKHKVDEVIDHLKHLGFFSEHTVSPTINDATRLIPI